MPPIPSINYVGDSLAGFNVPSIPYSDSLRPHALVKSQILLPNDNGVLVYNRDGVLDQIRKSFNLTSTPHLSSNIIDFGRVHGRHLFYSEQPLPNFFNLHKGADVSLVIGSNSGDVPENWAGRAVLLSYLYAVKDNEIITFRPALDYLFPGHDSPVNSSLPRRKPKERLPFYYRFLFNVISRAQEQHARHPERALSLMRPSVRDIHAWLQENGCGEIRSDRTIRRDIQEFLGSNGDALFRKIWENLCEPDIILRRELLMVLSRRVSRPRQPHTVLSDPDAEVGFDSNGATIMIYPDLDEDKKFCDF